MPAARRVLLLLAVVVLALTAGPAAAQTDTTAAVSDRWATHTPRGALWRAAAVPGWGQWYNRQPLKIPIVYLGLGGLSGLAIYTNNRYLLYRHAYLFTARTDAEGAPVFPEYADDYTRLIADLGLSPEANMTEGDIASRRARLEPNFRAQRDNLRRNRDLLYVGIGLWYGLSILDAFVSAHLLDFDISEDLSVTVVPQPAPTGVAATVYVRF